MGSPSTVAPAVDAASIDSLEAKRTNAKDGSEENDTLTPSDRVRGLTDTALRFLSNASNETLGACAVGLCASTYLILGRVGLVLIGAVGGIVLHATWESAEDGGSGVETGLRKAKLRRKELGVEVAKRVLDWRDRKKSPESGAEDDNVKFEASVATKPLDYWDFEPATGAALTILTDAVVRDYVEWWYSPLLPAETTFPSACRQTLTSFVLSLSNHLAKKRPADIFIDFLANSTSIIVVFLGELSTALRAGQGQPPPDAIHRYLREEPDSHLANVISRQQQERKLGMVADDILSNFLDSKAFDFPPAKTFLRQILAGVVLETTVKTCSKPEWINGWIVYLLEDGEPTMMSVIDAGVEGIRGVGQVGPISAAQVDGKKRHARRISKAEEAMEEAMLEARRLSEMIAEEDARKRHDMASIPENEDAASTATTEGIATPTSSDSERNRFYERSLDSSVILDQTSDEIPPLEEKPLKSSAFTNFDQIVPSETLTPLRGSYDSSSTLESGSAAVLTLHKASVTIMDDGDARDKSALRSKPLVDYLLQIEPASSRFPGWMIVRKYQDFEPLHEVLRRISVVSGVAEFSEKHSALPSWKGQTKHYLRQNLERYLQHALRFEPLAESEAMKKFLEKETGPEKAPTPSKNVFLQGPAALETVGKGFVNVLGQAPKGLAGGGKAVLGGVQGVFGAVGGGLKKPTPGVARSEKSGLGASRPQSESRGSRASQESARMSSSSLDNQQLPMAPGQNGDVRRIKSHGSATPSQPSLSQESLHLPPRPSDVSDDYGESEKAPTHAQILSVSEATTTEPESLAPTPANGEAVRADLSQHNITSSAQVKNNSVTEEETRASIELVFAILTELYSLSSAWTIRLSLLSAAKAFLLRPNSPQLESLRLLLQDSIIDANFVSDTGLAGHISKLRENTLPSEEELKKWPAEMSDGEKETLRVKARKLLVERGMPPALTSVMGNVASGEALGRVFDCLQIEEVARGLIFALLLQVLRATTQ